MREEPEKEIDSEKLIGVEERSHKMVRSGEDARYRRGESVGDS